MLNSHSKKEEAACVLVIFKAYYQREEENAKGDISVQGKNKIIKCTFIFSFGQKAAGRISQEPMRLAPTKRMEGGWKNEGIRTEGTIPKDNICCLNVAKITVLLTESE